MYDLDYELAVFDVWLWEEVYDLKTNPNVFFDIAYDYLADIIDSY